MFNTEPPGPAEDAMGTTVMAGYPRQAYGAVNSRAPLGRGLCDFQAEQNIKA